MAEGNGRKINRHSLEEKPIQDNGSAAQEKGGTGDAPAVNPELGKLIRHRKRKTWSPDELAEGILKGNVPMLSRAITLVESHHPRHQEMAAQLVEKCLPYAGKSIRIGITGVPGAGKSTLIEALGNRIASPEQKLAVLAVDPSSSRSGGSILGDKTRMELLSTNPYAFVRPSPSGGTLGGVARKTRESVILCEAAGYSVIFIETVGVGQSETMVHGMTDFFLLVLIPGAGDELQGMKRGVVELADAVLVNKADGDNAGKAERAVSDYASAMHLLPPHPGKWTPRVMACSAKTNAGIDVLWNTINEYITLTKANGYFETKRREQNLDWLQETILDLLQSEFYRHPGVASLLQKYTAEVAKNKITPYFAARHLMETYHQKK
ncbi:MAG: methylmalonyl Co-A mutase-associated GTPase MeaB [Bacteroidales bacterium]|nr:methylmalonyl Co-A mutase-associated GTPase MeaB [Bacteroidales bacterium]